MEKPPDGLEPSDRAMTREESWRHPAYEFTDSDIEELRQKLADATGVPFEKTLFKDYFIDTVSSPRWRLHLDGRTISLSEGDWWIQVPVDLSAEFDDVVRRMTEALHHRQHASPEAIQDLLQRSILGELRWYRDTSAAPQLGAVYVAPTGTPEHMTGTVLMVRSPSRHVVVMTRPMGGPSVAMTYSPTDADALFLWAYVEANHLYM